MCVYAIPAAHAYSGNTHPLLGAQTFPCLLLPFVMLCLEWVQPNQNVNKLLRLDSY